MHNLPGISRIFTWIYVSQIVKKYGICLVTPLSHVSWKKGRWTSKDLWPGSVGILCARENLRSYEWYGLARNIHTYVHTMYTQYVNPKSDMHFWCPQRCRCNWRSDPNWMVPLRVFLPPRAAAASSFLLALCHRLSFCQQVDVAWTISLRMTTWLSLTWNRLFPLPNLGLGACHKNTHL
jgi:hypothetical protein